VKIHYPIISGVAGVIGVTGLTPAPVPRK